MSRAIDAAADGVLRLPVGLADARAAIDALELDVLFYQDIGLEMQSYLLSFARLAPVQCVSFGHPNTTGVPNMDWFVSNTLFETPDAASHYSERLFLLDDLPTLAYYHRPARPAQRPDRSLLGLPRSGTVYLCPQTLFKMHPDMDSLFAGILRNDPDGWIVLIRGSVARWVQLLQERFAQSMPDVARRVVFIDPLPSDGFLSLLAAADVVLDTVHFNGMNSSLEAFAMGTPVVTLPTQLQRGRHTHGMYRAMGLSDCVARDPDDYVTIASRLGRDRDWRSLVARNIDERSPRLFGDPRVVSEFARFFETAVAAPDQRIGLL
jgi:predicted O-linked N-acetylglucosamine transferase (SPINDLY family)